MVEPELNKYTNVIFLDVDGVLNCQLFYTEYFAHLERFDGIPLYKVVKKYLRKLVKKKEMTDMEYYKSQMCSKRMSWLNELCAETNSAIVLSASMRSGHTVEKLQEIFNMCGATFTIIDKTGYCDCRIHGVEINKWLQDNSEKWFGAPYYDFYRFAIIDDDSDMLLWQQDHFFQTDNFNGLTPTTCYKIKRYFTHKTF